MQSTLGYRAMQTCFAIVLVIISINGWSDIESNPLLLKLFTEDQADRSNNSALMFNNDVQRLALVKKLIKNEKLRSAEDYYYAAVILQHSQLSADYKKAQTLALKAVDLNPQHKSARWLACAAEDRYLMSIGKAQVWGTQFIGGAVYSLEPFDRYTKTDQERIANNVPTLKEIEQQLILYNGQ